MAGQRMPREPGFADGPRVRVDGRVIVFCGARDDTDAWSMARSLGRPVISCLLADAPEERPAAPDTRLLVGPEEHLLDQLKVCFATGNHVAVGSVIARLISPSCTVLVTGGSGPPQWSASARALTTDLVVAQPMPGVARHLFQRLESKAP